MAANSEGTASVSRRGPGKPFAKGTSGNRNGRPKVVFEIRDLAREFGPAGIAKLAEMAGLAPGMPAEAEAVRVAAIKELLDRGIGKSTQLLAGDTEAPPLQIDFRWADAARLPSSDPEALTEAVETNDAAGDACIVWSAC